MKVLVIDDDPHVRDALEVGIQLQWQDAHVICAENGEAGIDRFFSEAPDIVLIDVTMPRMNGYEVLRAIRRVSDAPVIMLTGRAEDVDQVRGLELGADDYVTKPFSHLALMARMRAVLRRAELPPPIQALPDFEAGDLAMAQHWAGIHSDGARPRLPLCAPARRDVNAARDSP
ncbi:MAG: response regulator [Chloroflexi bacterium]|nr:response regulator [Chloroflexota bacterium]